MCYHIYQMYQGLDTYIHRKYHSLSKSELAKEGEQGCKSVETIKMRKFKGVENVLAYIHLQGCKLVKRFLAIV